MCAAFGQDLVACVNCLFCAACGCVRAHFMKNADACCVQDFESIACFVQLSIGFGQLLVVCRILSQLLVLCSLCLRSCAFHEKC